MTFSILIGNTILKMFIIMTVGMAGSFKKVITHEGTKAITNVLLYIVTPALIIGSYQQELTTEKTQGLLIAIMLSIVSHLIGIGLSKVMIRKVDNPENEVERMSTIYSNCGSIGIPLIYSIYGAEGVFYVTAYLTVFNLLFWTHAVSLMSGNQEKMSLGQVFKSPNIIAIGIGLFMFFTQYKIPRIIFEPMQSIMAVNTPLAMLVTGATLIESDLISALKKSRVYYVALIKLILIPLVMVLVCALLKLNGMIANTVIIASACPTAATTTMFSLKFEKNANYSVILVSVTTILCIITIPCLLYIAQLIL